ncbi:portal protein [Microbacterium phage Zeta1847]|uniref:Portal protein n=1 Tax=Microbacterium phage Zeta1847 TaxID=2201444 RepID=A0A2Z4Q981_9CAUD|nr:portal protein [Microbacterium phage Zeta1847]AWY06637.1 portal protein [Microbacterium phage Zeta1847]
MDITPKLAEELDGKLEADLKRDGRLGLPKRYLAGDHDKPYMPRGARAEFKHIADRSITNWAPLVPDEFNKGLQLDGFRRPKAEENDPCWAYWQDNGLDARQTIAHRGALEYGTSYVLVLPGQDKSRPVIKPLSPLRSAAWYADDDDDFPEVGIVRLDTFREGNERRQRVAVIDDHRIVTYSRPVNGGEMRHERTEFHNLGVCPMVRFRDRLDGEAMGLVRPFKRHHDRINEVVFNILMAMQYASFRQRWATGLVIPVVEDEDDPEHGKPIEPFEAAVNRLWVSDSTDTRFGEFAQTEISGHQAEYKAAVATLAAAAQISPAVLTGDLTNVSNEALLSTRHATTRKLEEYKLLFGESWELVFRLACRAAGVDEPEPDAEVRWRDTSGQQMAATVDALGKLAQMLGVPQEALWERVPNVTDSELKRWRELAKPDALDSLTAEIMRQGAAADATLTAAQAAPPAPPAEPVSA